VSDDDLPAVDDPPDPVAFLAMLRDAHPRWSIEPVTGDRGRGWTAHLLYGDRSHVPRRLRRVHALSLPELAEALDVIEPG
jgi:hypothetical protein